MKLDTNFSILWDRFEADSNIRIAAGDLAKSSLDKYRRASLSFNTYLSNHEVGSYVEALMGFYRDRFVQKYTIADTAGIFTNLGTVMGKIGLEAEAGVCKVVQDLLWKIHYVATKSTKPCIPYLDRAVSKLAPEIVQAIVDETPDQKATARLLASLEALVGEYKFSFPTTGESWRLVGYVNDSCGLVKFEDCRDYSVILDVDNATPMGEACAKIRDLARAKFVEPFKKVGLDYDDSNLEITVG